jgi:hypothetical protein
MNKFTSIIITILLLIPSSLDACAVCYGAADDPMTNGMNMAILFLISVIGFVLMGVVTVIIYFARRAKLVNN